MTNLKKLFPNVMAYTFDEVELDVYKIVAERFGKEDEKLFKHTISWAFNRAFFYPVYRRYTAPMEERKTYAEPYKLWLDDIAVFARETEKVYSIGLAAYVRELARAEVKSYVTHEKFMHHWKKEKAVKLKGKDNRSWVKMCTHNGGAIRCKGEGNA